VRSLNGCLRSAVCLAVTLVVLCFAPFRARGETSVGVRVGGDNFEFGFLYNDYYHVEPRVVERCTESMSEPDVVVALQLARLSGVQLNVILDWRRAGISWFDVTHRCRLGTDIYYVELPPDPGPPYGRACGYWRKHPRQELRLSDDEVRGFVTLRALSDYSNLSAGEVIRMRKQGYTPVRIAESRRQNRSLSAATKAGMQPRREDTAPSKTSGRADASDSRRRGKSADHGKSEHGKSKSKGNK
jgi:hypothetical protein